MSRLRVEQNKTTYQFCFGANELISIHPLTHTLLHLLGTRNERTGLVMSSAQMAQSAGSKLTMNPRRSFMKI